MTLTTKKFIGGLIIGLMIGTIATAIIVAHIYTSQATTAPLEEITAAQYREQSLQYLEDIRNTADAVAITLSQNNK